MSSPWGMRLHPITHVWSMHYGLDLECPRGTRVSAVADGVVVFAGRLGCYGNVVILDHPGDFVSLYAHLSRFAEGLKPGVFVKAGQLMALSGDSGCVTGPHLHLECWRGKQRQRVNPMVICAPLRSARKGVRL